MLVSVGGNSTSLTVFYNKRSIQSKEGITFRFQQCTQDGNRLPAEDILVDVFYWFDRASAVKNEYLEFIN